MIGLLECVKKVGSCTLRQPFDGQPSGHDVDHGDVDHGDVDHGDVDHGDVDHGDAYPGLAALLALLEVLEQTAQLAPPGEGGLHDPKVGSTTQRWAPRPKGGLHHPAAWQHDEAFLSLESVPRA